MSMQSNHQDFQSMNVPRASSSLLGSLKNVFADIFAQESSQDIALNLLQDSKGFDPLKNPQSLVAPRNALRERTLDKRLPVRKAA